MVTSCWCFNEVFIFISTCGCLCFGMLSWNSCEVGFVEVWIECCNWWVYLVGAIDQTDGDKIW